MKNLSVVVYCVVLLPQLVRAQTAEQPPFSIPQQARFACRPIMKSPQPSDSAGAFALDYRKPRERFVYASYDSSGHPRMLVEGLVTKDSAGKLGTDARNVLFRASGDIGVLTRVDVLPQPLGKASHDAPATPARLPELKPVSAEEKARARVLADWLWTHRCRD